MPSFFFSPIFDFMSSLATWPLNTTRYSLLATGDASGDVLCGLTWIFRAGASTIDFVLIILFPLDKLHVHKE
jgi:hypothetical protein